MQKGQKKRMRRGGGYPELTSFSDIAFLLIIYFILATSFHQQVGLKTDIPSGQQAKEAKAEEKTVMLRPDGLFYGDRQMTFDEFRGELAQLDLPARPAGRRVVQFEAKPGVLWQEYYEVLAAIRGSGGEPGIVMETGGKGQ
ncbi:MAG: biopolymer transporter ExbD [Phycisphaerae bacterium]|nr:biopolymer transporter ExbD [Phycisphaerae bacterium]